jgi:1D-myo-inositol-tetrakisphosphate 5-kinase/inositol-polyphosphate multikinase
MRSPDSKSLCALTLRKWILTAHSDGVLSDINRELFIKPCTQAEVDFYESSIAEHPNFAEFMPTFMGTLKLSSNQSATIEERGTALIAEANIARPVTPGRGVSPGRAKTKRIITDQALVLENATAGFRRPNILDVKLGVRLYADDAHPDKKKRFDLVTQETTHRDFGFRIAGMRVWQGPAPNDDLDVYDGYKIYDKDYGRLTINKDNVDKPFRDFIFTKSAGIDEELGKLVAQAFVADLIGIQRVLENQESRMYSASLLFVFEGDGQALRATMEEASSRSSGTLTNGINGSSNGDEEYGEDYEDTTPKIYAVKVIDFAHAQWVPGMGPDENSLLGVRSVIKILKELGQDA